jgi:hypothetical protein
MISVNWLSSGMEGKQKQVIEGKDTTTELRNLSNRGKQKKNRASETLVTIKKKDKKVISLGRKRESNSWKLSEFFKRHKPIE